MHEDKNNNNNSCCVKPSHEYLKGNKAHANIAVLLRAHIRRRNKISDEDTDGADEDVFKPMTGVDFDHDGGGVSAEKVLLHPKDKLVIPGGIGVAIGVDAGGELPLGIHPGGGVGFHLLGNGLQILGGDDVDFEQLEGLHRRRHRAAPAARRTTEWCGKEGGGNARTAEEGERIC